MTCEPLVANRLVREKEACYLLGVSPSTLRRMERRSELPARRSISPNTRGWPLSDILSFIQARSATASTRHAVPPSA